MLFFSGFRLCCGGGATVTPAIETSPSSNIKQPDETGRANCGGSSHAATAEGLRKLKSPNASRNWKPKLHVISEDSVLMSHDSSRAVRSDDKLSVKVKAKSKPKVPSPTRGDDYWQSASLWAIPAFSPTPFSF